MKIIVDDYVRSAEPVGSRTIAKREGINFSPATIRNEMASDQAMDENGIIDFGLTVEGRLTDDLRIILYDSDREKEVKSFPKRNSDPAKLKAAEDKYKELKQTVKTVTGSQKTLLKKMLLLDQ